jgi:DNA-binding NtrC family response regulator
MDRVQGSNRLFWKALARTPQHLVLHRDNVARSFEHGELPLRLAGVRRVDPAFPSRTSDRTGSLNKRERRGEKTLPWKRWYEHRIAFQKNAQKGACLDVESILSKYAGDVAEAAAHAGIERESLYRLMRRYGLNARAFRREQK